MGNDVEVIVVQWLNTILGGSWTAHGDKPQDTPINYVLVDRDGGPRVAMVLDAAVIRIEVYHKSSRNEAKNQALVIADRIHELKAYADNITTAKVNSTVHVPDLVTGYERYSVFCDIACRR